jgi:hypothetical protein
MRIIQPTTDTKRAKIGALVAEHPEIGALVARIIPAAGEDPCTASPSIMVRKARRRRPAEIHVTWCNVAAWFVANPEGVMRLWTLHIDYIGAPRADGLIEVGS